MNTELLIGAQDGRSAVMPCVKSAEWRTEISGSAGRLICDIMWDKELDISEGASVRFKVNGSGVFFGYVFGIDQSVRGTVRLSCYDQVRYLLNKDTYVYENKTVSQLVRLIAEDFSLKTGEIQDSGYVIPYRVEESSTLLDMIESALELTLQNSGKRFVLYDDFGELCLKSADTVYGNGKALLIDGGSGQKLSYISSVDRGAYNRVKLFYNNKKSGKREIYIAENKEKIREWGVLQYADSLKQGENGQAKAEELLKLYGGKSTRVSAEGVFGDPDFRAGSTAALALNKNGAAEYQLMTAERVVHRFSDEGHFMDISLVS